MRPRLIFMGEPSQFGALDLARLGQQSLELDWHTGSDDELAGSKNENRPAALLFSLHAELLQPNSDAASYLTTMDQRIKSLGQRLDAALIVLGCSSFDPVDLTSTYTQTGETISLKVHRYNLALLELSSRHGIAIIDVDRILAEIGAGEHVLEPLVYDGEVSTLITDELIRIITDLGLFSPSPERQQINMPYVDRQIQGGTIAHWHKQPGDWVQTGDDIFDFSVTEISKMQRTGGSLIRPADTRLITKRDIEFTIRVSASSSGMLEQVFAEAGDYRRVGQRVATVRRDSDVVPTPELADNLPRFRAVPNFIEN
jgi:hypothetical protein